MTFIKWIFSHGKIGKGINMADPSSIYMRYFIYSPTQAEQKKRIESGISAARVKMPKILHNGVYRVYTDIVRDFNQARAAYGDARIVCQQDIRTAVLRDTD